MKTGFPRKRGNAIRTANSNAICDFRLPPRRPEVQKHTLFHAQECGGKDLTEILEPCTTKRHTFYHQKVCVSALSGGAAGCGNHILYSNLHSELHFRVFVETRFPFHAYVRIRNPINQGNGNLTYAWNENRVSTKTRKCNSECK